MASRAKTSIGTRRDWYPICASWTSSTRSRSSRKRCGSISISWSPTSASGAAREILTEHKATFDAVENTYGVDRHVITAIWGVETKFGTVVGERPLVRSTATLACVGRRQDYFQNEFLAVLEILARGDVAAEQLKGSWAGAFGGTQFMPTVFKRYAVDFDRDGRRNLVGSIPDLIASTANYLKQNGWVAGQGWGYEVVVPKGFDYRLADRARVQTIRQWEQVGIRRAGNKPFRAAG